MIRYSEYGEYPAEVRPGRFGQEGSASFSRPARLARYNGAVVTLSENEERLLEALRALPPDVADQVINWATRLHDLATGKSVDWSDTWTEEDLVDARRASLSSFDAREHEPS